MRKMFQELVTLAKPTLERSKRVILFDFSEKASIEGWRYGSDAQYGGYSTVNIGTNESKTALLFEGDLSSLLPEKKYMKGSAPGSSKFILRSGFAACKSDISWFKQKTIHSDFDAVELVVRGEEKVYNCNISPNSFGLDDVYQGKLKLRGDPTQWQTKVLKYNKFVLKGQGKVKHDQRTFNHSELKGIGLSIADLQDGPFKLEIKKISLVATDLPEPEEVS